MINMQTFDATTSGVAAAERANQLEGAMADLLDCLKARSDLAGTTAYKGMGVNIMQEKAGKLPAAIRWAEMLMGREKDAVRAV